MSLLFFLSTFVLLLAIFALLVFLRRPVYQLSDANVIRLLELVLAGEASDDDWNVFIDLPIRYNDVLENVRQHCEQIGLEHMVEPKSGYLFSEKGLSEIRVVLESLQNGDVS